MSPSRSRLRPPSRSEALERLARSALVVVALAASRGDGAGVVGDVPEVVRRRVDELVAVLASGDADRYEALARERFVPTLLARRTPQERRQFIARFHGDFGPLRLVTLEASGPFSASAAIEGKGGTSGVVTLDLEPEPPHRFTNLGIRVEQGGGPEPKTALPALPDLRGADAARIGSALDPPLTRLASDGVLSGVVLLARDGKPVYTRAFGLADEERKGPNTPATRFNVASIGKQFTKVAIGQLLAKGKLALSDTVARHLPAYPNADAARKMTLEQLLEHRAGVVDIFRDAPGEGKEARAPRSNHDWFLKVAPQPLEFEPGSQTRYCNGCYAVLGEVVAAVSGMPYEEYLTRNVFGPAGMTGAAFLAGSDPVAGQAVEYTRGPQGMRKTSLGPGGRGSAAGGVYATASDLLAYDTALRSYRLLDRERTAWFLRGDASGPRATGSLGVAGGSPGTNAYLGSDGVVTVVVLTNHDPRAGEDLGAALLKAFAP